MLQIAKTFGLLFMSILVGCSGNKPAPPVVTAATPSDDVSVPLPTGTEVDPSALVTPGRNYRIISTTNNSGQNPEHGRWGPGPRGLPVMGFMGVVANGFKVVYVIDTSASMVETTGPLVFGAQSSDVVKQSLKESIAKLRINAAQQFDIVTFSGGTFSSLFKSGVQIAYSETRQSAMEFIDGISFAGKAEPVPAIQFALAEKPDVIFFLVSGLDHETNFAGVEDALKAGNRDGHISINCIYIYSEENPGLTQALKQISNASHGKFKAIAKSDLNR